MTLSPTDRMAINRGVRAILVRHFIDLGRMSIHPSSQGVRLQGTFVRLPGVAAPLTPELMVAIMGEIARVPGVRRVEADFENWTQEGGMGGWHEVARKKSALPKLADSGAGSAPRIFEIPTTDHPKPE